jgi:pyruvoyl-dependent arginine decarboxylase (PvlArgDC)
MSAHKDKVVNLSISKRIHAGKCLTCFEAGIYLAAQTALLIATAFCLWHPKEGHLEGNLKDMYSKVCNDNWVRDEV